MYRFWLQYVGRKLNQPSQNKDTLYTQQHQKNTPRPTNFWSHFKTTIWRDATTQKRRVSSGKPVPKPTLNATDGRLSPKTVWVLLQNQGGLLVWRPWKRAVNVYTNLDQKPVGRRTNWINWNIKVGATQKTRHATTLRSFEPALLPHFTLKCHVTCSDANLLIKLHHALNS